MTLDEWREVLHPMVNEQPSSGDFEIHNGVKCYIPKGYKFVCMNSLGEVQIKKIEGEPPNSLDSVFAERDNALTKLEKLKKLFHDMRVENNELKETVFKLAGIEAGRDRLTDKLIAIRKLVNTSPVYSPNELSNKFEEIKKLLDELHFNS